MYRIYDTTYLKFNISGGLGFLFFICLLLSFSEVSGQSRLSASIDSTTIKIGEQIKYKIEVQTDPGTWWFFLKEKLFLLWKW